MEGNERCYKVTRHWLWATGAEFCRGIQEDCVHCVSGLYQFKSKNTKACVKQSPSIILLPLPSRNICPLIFNKMSSKFSPCISLIILQKDNRFPPIICLKCFCFSGTWFVCASLPEQVHLLPWLQSSPTPTTPDLVTCTSLFSEPKLIFLM